MFQCEAGRDTGNCVMNEIIEIDGGFKILKDSCIGSWQLACQKLDHDEFLPPLACQYIPEGGIVIDAGAYVGDHTICYSRKVGKTGVVMAIEAGAQAYECLAHNAKLMESPVFTYRAALSNEEGQWFSHKPNSENMGGSTLETSKYIEVSLWCTTIDRIMHIVDAQRLDFIKIDCEGFEYKILLGSVTTIEKFRPTMLIEINSARLEEQSCNSQQIFDFLSTHNYSWKIVQPECQVTDVQYDIICIPLKV